MSHPITPLLDYTHASPDGIKALGSLTQYLKRDVDPRLRALVELRVSQMNGCAYCLDLHTHEARAAGERQQRLDVLPAWRETAFFSEKEQAALAWAEALTELSIHGAQEELYEALHAHFSEKEIVDLTLVITTMNAWNRISISFRNSPKPRA